MDVYIYKSSSSCTFKNCEVLCKLCLNFFITLGCNAIIRSIIRESHAKTSQQLCSKNVVENSARHSTKCPL